jgi:pyruvate-ferredoxin/flavodoxin oxidoreductase
MHRVDGSLRLRNRSVRGDAARARRPLWLGSAEFTPAMCKAVLDNLSASNRKTLHRSIQDDLSGTSIPFDSSFASNVRYHQGSLLGLGSDGTVGANKNS